MSDKKLLYCQHMLALCESQASEWEIISESLSSVSLRLGASRRVENQPDSTGSSSGSDPQLGRPRIDPAGEGAPAVAEDPNRMRVQLRVAHALRGLILIFALGLPRVFYYIYGGYCILVLSGAVERMQSAEFRALFTGSRASLEIELARLRLRQETLGRLQEMEAAIAREEPVDEEHYVKEQEVLSQFRPEKPWVYRFLYQSIFMFVYTLLPSCHPHREYLL